MKISNSILISAFLLILIYQSVSQVNRISRIQKDIIAQNEPDKAAIISGFDPVLGQRLQHALDSIMAEYNVIGASTSVLMPEKGSWNGVYGMSNPAVADPMRPDMLLGIASTTKMYVATLMLELAEEGLLSLDDSLQQWLPSFNNINSNITIRQLLSHSSGVYDYLGHPDIWNDMYSDFSAYWSPEKVLTYVRPPYFQPGVSGRYSNTNYFLAGMIIKEVTGDSTFTQTLHDKILNSFNLLNTMVDVEEPLVAELAHAWYDYDNDNIREDVYDNPRTSQWSSVWTAAAMMATAEDLCRFTWHNYRGDILSQASINAMLDFNSIAFGSRQAKYGLGTEKFDLLGQELYGHSGNLDWYTAFTVYSPKYDISISALVNQDPYDFIPPNFGPRYATIELLRVLLDYFAFPHDKVHPLKPQTAKSFFNIGTDSIYLSVQINNPGDHQVQVTAYLKNKPAALIDSTMLYDDGSHGDSLAADNIFSGYFLPVSDEDDYTLSVKTLDLDSLYQHQLAEEFATRITTIGPLLPAEMAYIDTGYIEDSHRQIILPIIHNYGQVKTAEDLTVTLSTQDARIQRMIFSKRSIPDLEPGTSYTATIFNFFQFQYAEGYLPDSTLGNPITFDVTISSAGFHYWKSSFDYTATKIVASLEGDKSSPEKFALFQNYPNPFNPITNIEFHVRAQNSVPQRLNLSIYNLLGQKVATLINKKLPAGNHNVPWDASGFTSGIYIYTLETEGGFRQSRKLVLLK